jgi:NAD(P)-dependent dehydrogenase (short-subunit alcohol dehydrogenase family)
MSGLAMITGAAGGLGRSVTAILLSQGWQVVLVGRDINRLCRSGVRSEAVWVVADVSTAEGAATAFQTCIEKTGRAPDALINCAGSVLITPLHRTSESQYRQTISSNLDTSFFALQAFVSACMKSKQAGAAVLVSSVAARIGIVNHEAVAAAKAAVESLVRSAAATYSRNNIRVNAVAPGLMRTPATEKLFTTPDASRQFDAQYPLGRHGHVRDVAQSIAWLVSKDAAWITGQVLPVDGGFTAVRPLLQVKR